MKNLKVQSILNNCSYKAVKQTVAARGVARWCGHTGRPPAWAAI